MFKYFCIAVLVGLVNSQATDPSIEDALGSLPPELEGKIDQKQVQAIQNKSMEIFKQKCEKNGGPDAYENAQAAFKNFQACMSSLIDPSALQEEIEEAKPKGEVDQVFQKYCNRKPEFRNCLYNMTDVVEVCLSAEERKSMKTVHNITEQLAEFVCFKDGDRIALFISENGPECIREKQEDIQNCFNSTMGSSYSMPSLNLGEENFTATSLPKIAFGEKECGQFTELQKCVVASLETCKSPTSANIVEALFKFALKATPCNEFMEKEAAKKRLRQNTKKPNSAQTIAVSGLALSAVVLRAMF